MINLDGGQDALSFGGANVDGAAATFNNLTERTAVTSVGQQVHIPAQTQNFDNSSSTIAVGAANFIGIPTMTGDNATLTMTKAATLYVQGAPVAGSNVTHTTAGYSLWVDAGATQLDGTLGVGGLSTFSGDVHVGDGQGVVVGHTAQATVGTVIPEVQILGTTTADSRLLIGKWGDDASPAALHFVKSRDPAIYDGTWATVADNDVVGSVSAYVDDLNSLNNSIASIDFVVDDSSPSGNNVGGSIVFNTTESESAGSQTAMVINDDGAITKPQNPAFLTQGSGVAGVTGDGTVYTLVFGTEKFDRGGNLSGSTFTAPVSGIYHFMGSVETRDAVDGTNNDGSITLVTSARSYTVVRGDWGAMSMTGGIESCVQSWSTLANLDAGDTAYVTLVVSGGASRIVDVEASGLFFSGRLVG